MFDTDSGQLFAQYTVLAAYVIYAIYSIGLAFEGRRTFMTHEVVRQISLPIMVLWLFGMVRFGRSESPWRLFRSFG